MGDHVVRLTMRQHLDSSRVHPARGNIGLGKFQFAEPVTMREMPATSTLASTRPCLAGALHVGRGAVSRALMKPTTPNRTRHQQRANRSSTNTVRLAARDHFQGRPLRAAGPQGRFYNSPQRKGDEYRAPSNSRVFVVWTPSRRTPAGIRRKGASPRSSCAWVQA